MTWPAPTALCDAGPSPKHRRDAAPRHRAPDRPIDIPRRSRPHHLADRPVWEDGGQVRGLKLPALPPYAGLFVSKPCCKQYCPLRLISGAILTARPMLAPCRNDPPPRSHRRCLARRSKAKPLGTVEATDADEAIEKAAREFNVIASKLIAMRRR